MSPKRKRIQPAVPIRRSCRKIANDLKVGETSKTEPLRRCRDWILDQRAENNDIHVAEQIDVDDEGTYQSEDEEINVVSSLASIRNKRTAHKLKEKVYFACEWKDCFAEFCETQLLHDHVTTHVTSLRPIQARYCCEWDLCSIDTESSDEITRHILYHAYHTILKTYGESLAISTNMPRCTNDSRNRNIIPDLSVDFVCEWSNCSRTFKSIFLFHKHISLHCTHAYAMQSFTDKTKKAPVQCGWSNCTSKFPNRYRLDEHCRKHGNGKVIGCYQCGTLFASNTKFFDHCKRQIANNTHEFQCTQCFKYFSSERLLRNHISVHVNCLKCTLCDMTCNTSYILSKHIRYKHISERPYKCFSCDYKAVLKQDLEKHILRMHENKLFGCMEFDCDFTCKSLERLKKHENEAHDTAPSVYACHCCSESFPCGRKLSHHLIHDHQFQLPSGHSRFFYRADEYGIYRLQTMRIESLEVSRQILQPKDGIKNKGDAASPAITKKNKKGEGDHTTFVEVACKISGPDGSTGDNSSLVESNIVVTIVDVDKDGNIIKTLTSGASEIIV